MNLELPPIIQNYVEASNQHDVKSILACFSDNAVVRDEGETLRAKEAIEDWIAKTIAKYEFQFKPVGVRKANAEIVAAIEVSGTFPGAPSHLIVTLRSKRTRPSLSQSSSESAPSYFKK